MRYYFVLVSTNKMAGEECTCLTILVIILVCIIFTFVIELFKDAKIMYIEQNDTLLNAQANINI